MYHEHPSDGIGLADQYEQRGTCGFADPEPRQPVDRGSTVPLEEMMAAQAADDKQAAEQAWSALVALFIAAPEDVRSQTAWPHVARLATFCGFDREEMYASCIAAAVNERRGLDRLLDAVA